jgi:hypothetical protein
MTDASPDPATVPPADYVASPCISVCSIDKSTRQCIGCLRTLDEIGAWRTMTSDQQRAVVAACVERAKTTPRRLATGQVMSPDHPKLARFKRLAG